MLYLFPYRPPHVEQDADHDFNNKLVSCVAGCFACLLAPSPAQTQSLRTCRGGSGGNAPKQMGLQRAQPFSNKAPKHKLPAPDSLIFLVRVIFCLFSRYRYDKQRRSLAKYCEALTGCFSRGRGRFALLHVLGEGIVLSNRFIVLSLLCLHLCLAPSLFGNTGRVPLTPKAATREMLRLMPNEKGFTNKLKSLVKAGANVRAVDKRRMTVLHRVALWGGSASAAKFLLENGGDTPLTNNLRNLPLFQAIYSDNVKVAEVLAEHIDIDFVDASGQTALLLALEYESHKVAKLLLASGASLDVATKEKDLHRCTSLETRA